MITIYQLDAQGVFVGEREVDPMGPLPVPLAMTAPPKTTGDQVARWNGSTWEKLAERPALPPGPTAEEVLAQARAAAIEEIIADTERKRLDAVRDAVAVEFKDAKSEKDVSDKLAQLKLAGRVKA